MKSLFDLYKEADDDFRQLALDKDAAHDAYRHITSTIDHALSEQNLSALCSLIPYIEEGDGHLAFAHIGKTHRILRMLRITELELKYQMTPFPADCDTFQTLWEKYMLTLFALRRVLFKLSEASTTEAVSYLQNRPPSCLAVYVMTQDDLLVPTESFYEELISVFADSWSPGDIAQFCSLIQTGQEPVT